MYCKVAMLYCTWYHSFKHIVQHPNHNISVHVYNVHLYWTKLHTNQLARSWTLAWPVCYQHEFLHWSHWRQVQVKSVRYFQQDLQYACTVEHLCEQLLLYTQPKTHPIWHWLQAYSCYLFHQAKTKINKNWANIYINGIEAYRQHEFINFFLFCYINILANQSWTYTQCII